MSVTWLCLRVMTDSDFYLPVAVIERLQVWRSVDTIAPLTVGLRPRRAR